MAVFEIHVVRRNGTTVTLYTDRQVRVGDRLRIGASVVIATEQLRTPGQSSRDLGVHVHRGAAPDDGELEA